jgi:hypothetical protein
MAKERRRPLRLILLSALAGAIVLAILYLRCGPGGFGIGGGKGDSVGKGDDAKKGVAALADAGATGPAARPACKLRLDAAGVSLDGKPSTIGDAVTACKKAGSAELTVTGDAAFGKRNELRDGLREVGVPVLEKK